ncbi:DOMON-like domain-containing protein [uncultured Croceicoccus sp.]|uniref:DOMON-like domain-containing protein n=1 Tax=uncultured Croceicoccus sp. TaxID=1295329 RepID=UPI002601D744|nr:DOMON-like domain-containing protein [uncultured Croceicoccus sp.]
MAMNEDEWIALLPHPAGEEAPYAVSARVGFASDGRWRIDYRVTGDVGGIVWPRPRVPERADGLWQHTCFELFAMGEGGGYHEWNFAPDGCWAAYEFADYRAPVSPPPATFPPVIDLRMGDVAAMRVAVDVWPVTGVQPLAVGLCAVIERTSGDRDLWALAHGEGRPDFHAPACFAAKISPPMNA